MKYGKAFEHIQKYVMPTVQKNAEKEKLETNKHTGPRQSHFHRILRGTPATVQQHLAVRGIGA